MHDTARPDDDGDRPPPEHFIRYALEELLERWLFGLADARSAPTPSLRRAAAYEFWHRLVMTQDHDIQAYGTDAERGWRDALTLFLVGLTLGLTAEEMHDRLTREPRLIG